MRDLSSDPNPWDPNSKFHQFKQKLQKWNDSRPADLQLRLSSLYARKTARDFGAFVHLHLHFDQIGMILNRIAMPGFEESLPEDFKKRAPEEWVNRTRLDCYHHAKSLGQKIEAVTKRFPDFIPRNWSWNIFVYGSIREQLVYLASFLPEGLDPNTEVHRATLERFEAMIHLLYKMTKWFEPNTRIARDMLCIVERHGFALSGDWVDELR